MLSTARQFHARWQPSGVHGALLWSGTPNPPPPTKNQKHPQHHTPTPPHDYGEACCPCTSCTGCGWSINVVAVSPSGFFSWPTSFRGPPGWESIELLLRAVISSPLRCYSPWSCKLTYFLLLTVVPHGLGAEPRAHLTRGTLGRLYIAMVPVGR